MLICRVSDCRHNDGEGGCSLDTIIIDDDEPTMAGFLPQCTDCDYGEDD